MESRSLLEDLSSESGNIVSVVSLKCNMHTSKIVIPSVSVARRISVRFLRSLPLKDQTSAEYVRASLLSGELPRLAKGWGPDSMLGESCRASHLEVT